MNKKNIHVVSALTYRSMVTCALKKLGIDDEVTYLPIDFSLHYIPKDFSDKELCFSIFSNPFVMKDLSYLKDLFDKLKAFINKDFIHYEKVIVWHGEAPFDLLLLYLMSVLVDDTLYRIDIRDNKEWLEKVDYKKPYMGHISYSDIIDYNFLSFMKPVSDTEKTWCQLQWTQCSQSPFPYHLCKSGEDSIKGYPIDFMDDVILQYAEQVSSLRLLVNKVFNHFDYL